MKIQLLTAAVIAVAAMGAPALGHAAPANLANEELRQAVVSYADLNLATATGQAVLHARLRQAVQTVCGERPDVRDLGAQTEYRACVSTSLSAAKAAFPAATVMAGSNGHHG